MPTSSYVMVSAPSLGFDIVLILSFCVFNYIVFMDGP